MSASNDLKAAQLSFPQSGVMDKPNTIASTTTIAPTNRLTFVSGTIDIATITPPADGAHELVFIFTSATPGDLLTTGNILVGSTTVTQYVPVIAYYNPNEAKYYLK